MPDLDVARRLATARPTPPPASPGPPASRSSSCRSTSGSVARSAPGSGTRSTHGYDGLRCSSTPTVSTIRTRSALLAGARRRRRPGHRQPLRRGRHADVRGRPRAPVAMKGLEGLVRQLVGQHVHRHQLRASGPSPRRCSRTSRRATRSSTWTRWRRSSSRPTRASTCARCRPTCAGAPAARRRPVAGGSRTTTAPARGAAHVVHEPGEAPAGGTRRRASGAAPSVRMALPDPAEGAAVSLRAHISSSSSRRRRWCSSCAWSGGTGCARSTRCCGCPRARRSRSGAPRPVLLETDLRHPRDQDARVRLPAAGDHFLLVLSLHFSWELSRLEDRTRKLAEARRCSGRRSTSSGNRRRGERSPLD